MIYTKKANFPYPILMNNTDDYINSMFDLDIDINENTDSYIISLEYTIESDFINNLIASGDAELYMIIKSKDNQFHKVNPKIKKIEIMKSRLGLNDKTTIQLMIQAKRKIYFRDNKELNSFYDGFKEVIEVEKGNVLGFSNTVIFDGSQNKPYELFEKMVDVNMKSDISVILNEEVILIKYRDENMMFSDLPNSRNLNNLYLYIGLQKALFELIAKNSTDFYDDESEYDSDGLNIQYITEIDNFSPLNQKLITLMKSKGIEELHTENIDEVIHLISDNMVGKYVNAVRGLVDAN